MDAALIKRSRSGLLTVLTIFLFGGIFVGGLFFNARRNVPPELAAATSGLPHQLRIVSCNLRWSPASAELLNDLEWTDAHFILLQQVRHKEAERIAIALNMRHNGQLQLYYSPTNPNTTQAPGNAILARHPIYQGRAIATKGATDAGIWVEPIVSGNKFLLGCVDLTPPPVAPPAAKLRQQAIESLVSSWTEIRAPFVLGGLIPSDVALPAGLKSIDSQPASDTRFVASKELLPNYVRATARTTNGTTYIKLIYAYGP